MYIERERDIEREREIHASCSARGLGIEAISIVAMDVQPASRASFIWGFDYVLNN